MTAVPRQEIFHPLIIEIYNKFKEGIDKSDQFLAYHNVLQKTVRYCKTLFYHLTDIAVENVFVICKIKATEMGARTVTENDFCDMLVLRTNHGVNLDLEDPADQSVESSTEAKYLMSVTR